MASGRAGQSPDPGDHDGCRVRVAIADDSLLSREGLARRLREVGFATVAQAVDVVSLLAAVQQHKPDVAIVDVRMPPTYTTEGLVAAARLGQLQPHIGVLVLSRYVEADYALRLLEGGPAGVGYLLKNRVCDLAEFASAVRRVARGRSVLDPELIAQLLGHLQHPTQIDMLSERERDVLALMAEGRSNQAIGQRLRLTTKVVERHVRAIFSGLGLRPMPDDNGRVLAVLRYLDLHQPA
jgi:DNA-binding NarL/FixJ family response regulator